LLRTPSLARADYRAQSRVSQPDPIA